MVNTADYSADVVEAARSVLLEVSGLLGEYRGGMVVVGGWVPELLFGNAQQAHVGSIDVDLALDHRTLQEAGYRSIMELLLSRGYEQGSQPFIFHRKVLVEDREIRVQVDFLAGEYGGSTRRHRTQEVQDVHPRKARGCDLAFEMPVEITLRGSLPNGGLDSALVKVASAMAFIVMKAMALASRLKEKDAYDIYYCLINYPGGLDALIKEFEPFMRHGLVKESLAILASKFASPAHIGPQSVADFEEITEPEERARVQRDVFERVNYLVVSLT